MERRRSLCAGGWTARENRSPSKPSICWWCTCAGTRGKSLTNALWVLGGGGRDVHWEGVLHPWVLLLTPRTRTVPADEWWEKRVGALFVINAWGWGRGEGGRIRGRTLRAELWEILEGSVLDPPCPTWWPQDRVLWRCDWAVKKLIVFHFYLMKHLANGNWVSPALQSSGWQVAAGTSLVALGMNALPSHQGLSRQSCGGHRERPVSTWKTSVDFSKI